MNGDSMQNILRLYRFTNNQTDDKMPKITKNQFLVNYRIKMDTTVPKNEKKYDTI